MSTVIRWLLTALLSALAGMVAKYFEGACPMDAGSWVCGNWPAIVTVAAFVLGAFGVRVRRQPPVVIEESKDPLVIDDSPAPVPDAEWSDNVEQNTDTDSPIGGG